MKKKLNKVAKDTNLFLKKFIINQKKTDLLNPIKYGLLPGGKKIRSKLIVDVGRIFNIDYKKLIQISAAVECIHAYSLIHDDLPCMDNDRLRRGKLSTHKKFSESTAILAGNSLLTIAFEILSGIGIIYIWDDGIGITNSRIGITKKSSDSDIPGKYQSIYLRLLSEPPRAGKLPLRLLVQMECV